jgi:hypothetical protein
MPIGIICNTGTTQKSHIRTVGSTKTLCGRPVMVANKGDEFLYMRDAECNTCRRKVGFEPLIKK